MNVTRKIKRRLIYLGIFAISMGTIVPHGGLFTSEVYAETANDKAEERKRKRKERLAAIKKAAEEAKQKVAEKLKAAKEERERRAAERRKKAENAIKAAKELAKKRADELARKRKEREQQANQAKERQANQERERKRKEREQQANQEKERQANQERERKRREREQQANQEKERQENQERERKRREREQQANQEKERQENQERERKRREREQQANQDKEQQENQERERKRKERDQQANRDKEQRADQERKRQRDQVERDRKDNEERERKRQRDRAEQDRRDRDRDQADRDRPDRGNRVGDNDRNKPGRGNEDRNRIKEEREKKRLAEERRRRNLERERKEREREDRLAEERRREHERRREARIEEERRLERERQARREERRREAERQARLEEERLERERQARIAARIEAQRQIGASAGWDSGQRQGYSDGSNEGYTSGDSEASTDARQSATSQANTRDRTNGYRYGLLSGKTDDALKTSYEEGLAAGNLIATEKASGEDYADAFNQSLNSRKNAQPTHSMTIDMSEVDPIHDAQFGQVLVAELEKNLVSSPSYSVPNEFVPYIDSSAPSSGVSASFSSENAPAGLCQGRSQAGINACENAYQSSFSSGYSSAYENAYESSFSRGYSDNYADYFNANFPSENSAVFSEAAHTGAIALGKKDGYDAKYSSEAAEYRSRALQDIKGYLRSHAILNAGNVVAKGTGSNGAMVQGESISISVEVSNLGFSEISEGTMRLMVTKSVGTTLKAGQSVLLEAAAADTKVNYINAVVGKVNTKIGSKLVSVEGILEYYSAEGTFIKLKDFSLSHERVQPFSISSLRLDDALSTSDWVDASVTLENKHALDVKQGTLSFGSRPGFIFFEVSESNFAGLNAGESINIPVKVKAGVWLSQKTAVSYFASITHEESRTDFEGEFSLRVARQVDLKLDRVNGQVFKDGFSYRVKAGTRLVVEYDLANNTKSPLSGDFNVRIGKSTSSMIKASTGSNVGVRTSYVGVKRSANSRRFSLDIPKSLAGTKQNVMFTLHENGTLVHAPVIYMTVE